MKKILLPFYAICMLATITTAQTPLPYYTGFDNSAQQTGWNAYRKGTLTTGGWVLSTANSVSAPDALVHFAPAGGAAVTDDWFVSPMFDFSSGATIDSIWNHFSGAGTPAAGDTLAIYLLNGSTDPSFATSMTLLHDYSSNYVNDNTWHVVTGIAIPPTSGPSYLALHYTALSTQMDVRFDNITLSSGTTGINAADAKEFSIHPNPSKEMLYLSEPASDIYIVDSNGKVVFQSSKDKVSTAIDVSKLAAGNYLLKASVRGDAVIKSFEVYR